MNNGRRRRRIKGERVFGPLVFLSDPLLCSFIEPAAKKVERKGWKRGEIHRLHFSTWTTFQVLSSSRRISIPRLVPFLNSQIAWRHDNFADGGIKKRCTLQMIPRESGGRRRNKKRET